MSNCYKNKSYAFTLAEVLITLLIIGVVASIVIPSLLQNTQDAELKTAWKKSYAEFSQAAMKMTMDNGGTLMGLFTSDNEVNNQFKNYMNITRYCPYGTAYYNCWHEGNTYKYLSGYPVGYGNGTGFIQNNGNIILLLNRSATCVGGTNNHCLGFIVDINGFKGPNVIGKDIFGMYMFENSVKPRGYQGDDYQNTCDTNHSGYSCSAQYLYQ